MGDYFPSILFYRDLKQKWMKTILIVRRATTRQYEKDA